MKNTHKIVAIPIQKDIEVGDIVKIRNTSEKYYKYFIVSCFSNIHANSVHLKGIVLNGKYPYDINKCPPYHINSLVSQQLLLLSESEGHKFGDWVYEYDNNIPIYQFSYDIEHYPIPNIIAAYPKLNNLPTFQESFLKEWVNNPVEEVEVEYTYTLGNEEDENQRLIPIEELQLTPNNEVICSISRKDCTCDKCEAEEDKKILEKAKRDYECNKSIEEAAEEYVKNICKEKGLSYKEHFSSFQNRLVSFAKSEAVKQYWMSKLEDSDSVILEAKTEGKLAGRVMGVFSEQAKKYWFEQFMKDKLYSEEEVETIISLYEEYISTNRILKERSKNSKEWFEQNKKK